MFADRRGSVNCVVLLLWSTKYMIYYDIIPYYLRSIRWRCPGLDQVNVCRHPSNVNCVVRLLWSTKYMTWYNPTLLTEHTPAVPWSGSDECLPTDEGQWTVSSDYCGRQSTPCRFPCAALPSRPVNYPALHPAPPYSTDPWNKYLRNWKPSNLNYCKHFFFFSLGENSVECAQDLLLGG